MIACLGSSRSSWSILLYIISQLLDHSIRARLFRYRKWNVSRENWYVSSIAFSVKSCSWKIGLTFQIFAMLQKIETFLQIFTYLYQISFGALISAFWHQEFIIIMLMLLSFNQKVEFVWNGVKIKMISNIKFSL